MGGEEGARKSLNRNLYTVAWNSASSTCVHAHTFTHKHITPKMKTFREGDIRDTSTSFGISGYGHNLDCGRQSECGKEE